jgi:hypothetical protein
VASFGLHEPGRRGTIIPVTTHRAMIAAGFVLLAIPAVAMACTGCTPREIGSLPGLAGLAGLGGASMPLLAGILEAPFVRWAGVERHSRAVSIQANFLASLVTTVAGAFAFGLMWGNALAMGAVFGAYLLQVLLEHGYVSLRVGRRLPMAPFFLANLATSGVLFGVGLVASMWNSHLLSRNRFLFMQLSEARPVVELLVLVTVLAATAWAFRYRPRAKSRAELQRGFEVVT